MKRRSLTRVGDRAGPRTWRLVLNKMPQARNTGLKIRHISDDFRTWRFELPLRFRNRNYFGTHFGGTMYAASDPYYVLAFTKVLGRDYIVWNQESTIRFRKPGKGTLHFDFHIDEATSAELKAACEPGAPVTRTFPWVWTDADGTAIAEVDQTLYFRKKPRAD